METITLYFETTDNWGNNPYILHDELGETLKENLWIAFRDWAIEEYPNADEDTRKNNLFESYKSDLSEITLYPETGTYASRQPYDEDSLVEALKYRLDDADLSEATRAGMKKWLNNHDS